MGSTTKNNKSEMGKKLCGTVQNGILNKIMWDGDNKISS